MSSVKLAPPLFVTQTLPELSIATEFGMLKFAPGGAKFPNRVPVLFKAVALLPLAFVTQTRPELSIASPIGWLNIEPAGAKLPNRVQCKHSCISPSAVCGFTGAMRVKMPDQ
jgi:hypothetical protein